MALAYVQSSGCLGWTPSSNPSVPVGTRTHTVQPGENLFRISLRYGTTVAALSLANGITNPALIYVGQVIVIP
jgi:spore germination protein